MPRTTPMNPEEKAAFLAKMKKAKADKKAARTGGAPAGTGKTVTVPAKKKPGRPPKDTGGGERPAPAPDDDSDEDDDGLFL